MTKPTVDEITESANHLANDMLDMTKMFQSNKIDRVDDTWSKVVKLTHLMSACAELSRALILKERIQQQQDDLAKLKQGS